MKTPNIDSFIEKIATAPTLTGDASNLFNELLNVVESYKSAFNEHPNGCELRSQIALRFVTNAAVIAELSTIAGTHHHEPTRFSPFHWCMTADENVFSILFTTPDVDFFIIDADGEFAKINS